MFDSATTVPPPVSRPRDASLLARAVALGPGAAAMAVLDRIDVAGLDECDRVDLAACWDAQEGWLIARRYAAVAAVAVPSSDEGLPEDVQETSVQAELAGALRISPTTAGRRMTTAAFLSDHRCLVPALESGALRYGHLAVLERELMAASAATVDAVIDQVLPGAGAEAPSRLRARVRKTLARVDAAGMADRIRAKANDRSCDLSPGPDLQSTITVTGPHPMTAWAFRIFDAWARHEQNRRKDEPEPRPTEPGDPAGGADPAASADPDLRLAALRADAVIAAAQLLAHALGETGTAPDPREPAGAVAGTVAGDVAGGRRRGRSWSTAIVLCPLATALGLAEEPGFVPGYGYVPAAIARDLLADADQWRRFLTDHGRLVDAGAGRYRPSDALRELVTARDQTCTYPAVRREALVDRAEVRGLRRSVVAAGL